MVVVEAVGRLQVVEQAAAVEAAAVKAEGVRRP